MWRYIIAQVQDDPVTDREVEKRPRPMPVDTNDRPLVHAIRIRSDPTHLPVEGVCGRMGTLQGDREEKQQGPKWEVGERQRHLAVLSVEVFSSD